MGLVHSLLKLLSPTLTSLIIDMQLRSLYPDEDSSGVRPILHDAFTGFPNLEDFCSARDELYVATGMETLDNEVFQYWPRLKRLALYNPDVSNHRFCKALSRCKALTHLVLTRANGLREDVEADDIDFELPGLRRILIVNTRLRHIQNPAFAGASWGQVSLGRIWGLKARALRASSHADPGQDWAPLGMAGSGGDATQCRTISPLLSIVRIDVDPLRNGEEIEACQEWVRDRANDGTLWEYPGPDLLVPTSAPAGAPLTASSVRWSDSTESRRTFCG